MKGVRYSEVISRFDFFGYSPTLKVNKKNIHQTALGGIISVIYFVLVLLGLIYFGKEGAP